MDKKERFSVNRLNAANFIHTVYQKVGRKTFANAFNCGRFGRKVDYEPHDKIPLNQWKHTDCV